MQWTRHCWKGLPPVGWLSLSKGILMRLEPSSYEPEGPAAWCEAIASGFPWHFCKPAGGCWLGSLHPVLRTGLSVGLYWLIYTICSLFMLQFQYVWTMKLNLPVSNTLKWLCFPVLALSLTRSYLKGRLSAGSTVEFKVWYLLVQGCGLAHHPGWWLPLWVSPVASLSAPGLGRPPRSAQLWLDGSFTKAFVRSSADYHVLEWWLLPWAPECLASYICSGIEGFMKCIPFLLLPALYHLSPSTAFFLYKPSFLVFLFSFFTSPWSSCSLG